MTASDAQLRQRAAIDQFAIAMGFNPDAVIGFAWRYPGPPLFLIRTGPGPGVPYPRDSGDIATLVVEAEPGADYRRLA